MDGRSAFMDKAHLGTLNKGIRVWNSWRQRNPRVVPDLSEADLTGANLTNANLSLASLAGARLRAADLRNADLLAADLERADLRNANLRGSRFNGTNLAQASLVGADLGRAVIFGSDLRGAEIRNAKMFLTVIAMTNLSGVKGLGAVVHLGPSTIGIDTIYLSKGSIPAAFLRGAGVPENFITYAASLAGCAFEFFSCFISYASKDHAFVERLHTDLQNKGVRCWFAPEDLGIGEKTRAAIDESIRVHDKLLLVLSKYSTASDWVEQEVETALANERLHKRLVLLPIRIDDAVMKINTGWPALIKNSRNIGDFKKWKEYDAYQKALNRLLRDLKTEQ